MGDIPSVPDLEILWGKRLATLTLHYSPGQFGWYGAYRDLERVEEALDTARWRLACESWQWCRRRDTALGEDTYWEAECELASWRFEVRFQPWCPPSRALVVRPRTEVAR